MFKTTLPQTFGMGLNTLPFGQCTGERFLVFMLTLFTPPLRQTSQCYVAKPSEAMLGLQNLLDLEYIYSVLVIYHNITSLLIMGISSKV